MDSSTPPSPQDNQSNAHQHRKPTRLGRGLSSLMGQPVQVTPHQVQESTATAPAPSQPAADTATHKPSLNPTPSSAPNTATIDKLVYLPTQAVKPNPHQPRKQFNQDALQKLADSIRSEGIMQPIVVRHARDQATNTTGALQSSPMYELVAGERRLRAAQIAGLKTIPAVVRNLGDRQLAEWALIENLQREDLNPIERANAFKHLIDQFHLSHDQIAQRVGVERPTVSNSLRLLDLCDFVLQLIIDGLLSAGQAKAIVGIQDADQQKLVAQRAVAENWSVRQVEQEVRRLANGGTQPQNQSATKSNRSTAVPPHLRDLERLIGQQLSTKVQVKPGRKKGSGTLSIQFYSLDQFDSIMQRIGVEVNE